ncbi:MAG: hypothetical protein E7628_05315 [Ruminococcaceae bacterium]|nr:hypothetical protein [Oscillospiraceae bacterium]
MGKTILRIGTIIIFILCGMLIWRSCMVADKSTFSKPVATESLMAAYEDGESKMLTVKISAEISDDGYFSAYAFYYNPESGEAQFAVRWNDSVYEYTDMDEGHEYSFYLLNETTGETYPASAIESKKNLFYNYRRMVSSGVKVEEDEKLVLVMELRDGYTSTIVIKHAEQQFKEYKLPNKLKKELLR